MKCAGVAGAGASDDLLLSGCWLDPKLEASSPPPACHDLIDSLLAPPPLAELKPLPPFTGYTGHLSINGISGHHFHAIAQRLPEENNNYPTQSGYGTDHDVVSSSTCAADAEPPDLEDVKPFLEPQDTKPFSESSGPGAPDSCAASCSPPAKLFEDNHKQDMYDISSIEDIAAIIGSAIADTTVPNQPEDPDRNDSRDSWMDIDALISGACSQHGDKIVPHDLSEFGLPSSPPAAPHSHNTNIDFPCKNQDFKSDFLQKNLNAGSTLQTLLTHGYMPLLHNRLQNGPPVKQEAPSSTSYGMDVISTSSPPGNAVSTTDGVSGLLNGRYASHYALGLKSDGLCSPDRIIGYPHAHTTTSSTSSKKRSRAKAKQGNNGNNIHGTSLAFPSATAAELSGLLGKEKPVHRCGICNRGFLNKSNIKVHLRTHTGEKPFRCDVCAKAFRQKAHLIKHQQIHKRIGRD
ncbi:ichor [Bombyx mandarina]|uniref:Ichor n=1 Tax=Bombyx mandarina TaxID=7092 RepID=A0A6J2KPX3_BOMMA|nr:ichor [Bombyx mandarina]